MKNIQISKKTRQDLQWDELLRTWGSFCANARSGNRLYTMPFSATPDEALRRTRIVQALVAAHHQKIPLSVPELPDCKDLFSRLELGGNLPASAFCDILRVLVAVRDFLRGAQILGDPDLSQLASGLEPLSSLRILLEETIDEDGNVRPDASSELYGLRRRRSHLYGDLSTRMERMLERRDLQDFLQDKFVTTREGRFVLPVKSSFRHQVRGSIHGTSSSGQTVFIEPQEITDANNRLREIDVDIEVEEYRILAETAAHVAHETAVLRENERLLIELDIHVGAARMSRELNCTPMSFSDDGGMELVDIRHPLLLQARVNVVPNTVRLAAGQTMVITGPNAGGKTVVIKTVGLMVLMARMGLPVPARSGSIMPFFGDIHTLIGDDQSLATHVSTFSAQILHVKDILEQARPDHLLLLDELATGTDPQQGAFLAQAVLEHLRDRGIATLVTTHFTSLKTLALMDPRFVNVSVGGNALRPDYKLVPGEPGTSDGITVARQLGLPAPVITRATSLARDGDSRVDSLIGEITNLRRTLLQEKEELQKQAAETNRTQAELERQRIRLDRELREARKGTLDATVQELARCRIIIARLSEKAKKAPEPTSLAASLERVADEVDRLERSMRGPSLEPEKLSRGLVAYSYSLRHPVEILEVDMKKAKVSARAGNIVTVLAFDDLGEMDGAPVEGAKEKKQKTANPKPAQVLRESGETGEVGEPDEPFLSPAATLDLRGRRVEPALLELERHMDALFRDNHAGFLVIHGYGSGLLCSAVRDHLRASTYVQSFRPGRPDEGGDGVTAVYLI